MLNEWHIAWLKCNSHRWSKARTDTLTHGRRGATTSTANSSSVGIRGVWRLLISVLVIESLILKSIGVGGRNQATAAARQHESDSANGSTKTTIKWNHKIVICFFFFVSMGFAEQMHLEYMCIGNDAPTSTQLHSELLPNSNSYRRHSCTF